MTVDELFARYTATSEGAGFLSALRKVEARGLYDSDRARWDSAFDDLQDGFLNWMAMDPELEPMDAEIDQWVEDGLVGDAIWDSILDML